MAAGDGLCRRDEGEEEVDGALRVGRGGKDGALVGLEDLEPAGDVGGVVLTDLRCELEPGADEGGSEFGDKLFRGVGGIAPARAVEVTIEPGLVAGPMCEFMAKRGVVAFGGDEAREGRQLDVVETRAVIGLMAAVADVGRGRRDESLGLGVARVVGDGLVRLADEPVRQAIDLVGIEDDVGFEEGDAALDLAAGRVFALGPVECPGIDDLAGTLALADLGTERLRLFVGQPVRGDEAFVEGMDPQQEGVNAAIGLAVGAKWQRDEAVAGGIAPGPLPRSHALFEVRNDAIGD